jgi:hypothetical protein
MAADAAKAARPVTAAATTAPVADSDEWETF